MNDVNKDDEDSEDGEEGGTAAAKETDEISRKDAEIRRLIELRRNTPEEEKQRLKEVSKSIKKVKRPQVIQKNSRRLQRCQQHPRIQICREESSHCKD